MGKGSAHRRTRIFILACIAAVFSLTLSSYLARKRARTASPTDLPPKIAAGVDQQTQAFSLSRSAGGRTLYKIQASQVTNFKNTGKTVLHKVSIQLVGKDETRQDRITSEECEFDQASGELFMPGEVEMELDAAATRVDAKSVNASAPSSESRPLHIITSALHFNQNTGIASTDDTVRLQFSGGEGSSTGAVYNPQDRTITMKTAVRFTLWKNPAVGSPSPQGKQNESTQTVKAAAGPLDEGDATHLEASSLLFQSAEHKIFLSAPVVIRQGTREVRAGESEILLNGQQRAERAMLRGGVHASDRYTENISELEAATADLDFTPQGKVRHLTLESSAVTPEQKRDGSSPTLPAAPAGLVAWATASAASIKAGQARQVEMFFDEVQGHLARVSARGQVRVRLSPWQLATTLPALPSLLRDDWTAPPGSRSLQTQQAEMLMAADGETLREIRAQSGSTIQLIPAKAGEEKRTVQGESIHMQFSPEGELSEFTADNSVRFNAEGTGANSRKRASTSDHLWAAVDPRTHAVTELRQWGHFTYQDPDRQARAEQANYTAARDMIVLEGEPLVWNPSGKLSALKITLINSTNEVGADKQVSTTYYPTSSAGNPPPQPIHAVADRLNFNTKSEVARYQGNARLWQGSDMIEAPWIEFDRKQDTLDAREGVFSVFPGRPDPSHDPSKNDSPGNRQNTPTKTDGAPGKKTSAGNKEHSASDAAEGPIEIRASTLSYKDKEQIARYTGDVRMQNPSGTLTAHQLDITFTAPAPAKASAASKAQPNQQETPGGGRQIERAIATGNVSIVQPGRKATGERAEFIPNDNKVILTGNLAAISDAEKGNTQGTRLTYFTRDDRIFVEGEPGTPAETRRPVQRGDQH